MSKHYNNYSKSYSRPVEPETVIEEVDTVVEETPEEIPVIEETPVVESTPMMEVTGVVVDCSKLNMRFEPSSDSEIMCTLIRGTEVVIDEAESTDEFYAVCTPAGMEGYCMRKYIEVNP